MRILQEKLHVALSMPHDNRCIGIAPGLVNDP
jgi:hypothetical protein